MSARYDPKATFAYVREVQSLPPPTTIESAIRDDSNHTFSQPFFYSGHQLGGAGDTSTTAPAIGVSSVLYMGPGAMTPPPRASASLPPLQAFEEPSVLRNTFERDFPRPLRRVLSTTKQSTSSKSIIATAASSSGFGVKDELRCDRITALAMGSFLEGLGCPVHDCVTPNDFAVRLSEALRLQYNLDAELSTAKQSGKVKLLASRSVTLQRLEQKNATAAEGAQHAQQHTEAQWPKEAKQLVDELRRSLRGQAFDIEQLRDRLAGRIKQVDLKRSQRCVGALRDSLKDMAKEVGFIRDDIKDAFVQFTREFEELPVVKEIKERQPKLRQFDRPPAATEDGASTAPPAPAPTAVSAGALLRLSVRVTHAAAQYAGDVCNVDMPSDTTANQEFAPVLTRTLVGAAGLVHDDFQALLSHEGSERAIVAKALRSASWALQMLKELMAARERVSHLESQLSHAEQRNRELAAKASSSPPRDARSPPVSPTAPPAANRGGKNNTKAAAPAKAPSAKALPPSAGAGKKVIVAKPPPGAKTAAAVDDDGISNATNVPIPQPETNAPTTAAASSTPPPLPGVDAAPHQTDEHRQQQQQHDGEPPTTVSLPPPLSEPAPTTATTTVKHHAGGGQRSVSRDHHHRLRAQRVIQQALNDAAEAAVHPNAAAGDATFTAPALTEQSTIAELLDWLEATAEGTNHGGGDDVVVAKAASVASGQASPNWSDDDGDGSLSDADGATATAVQHRLDRAVPSGASAGPSNSRRSAATNTRGAGAAGTAATAIPSSGASTKPARRESVSNTATNNNSTAGGGHRRGAPAAVESDPTTAAKQGGSATPATTATAAGGRNASSGQPHSATRAAETQQQPPREDGSSATAAAVGPGKPNVKGPTRKTSASVALQPSQEQAKSTTPSTTTTAAVSDAKTSPSSGEVAPTATTKPPPPPAATVVKPSRKALAAALREATPSTASPPPSASPIPRDASGGGESPTNALDSPGAAAPLPTLPAISTTPSISAAQVLKFRFTAASPKPNNAATQRTVAHASDADRLERMRRSLEGGLQLHRFKAAHQLLFDERLDVPTPEPTAEELSMHRLGDTAPRH